MIKIVTDKKLILKYQRLFVEQLNSACTEEINCILGYQGGSEEWPVNYSDIFNFWFIEGKHNNRFENAFGFGRPQEGRSTSITVKINIPFEGIGRNIGGAFGREKNGEVLILHRGKIGGGRVGINRSLFFKNYKDKPITADDDGIENDLFLIGALGSNSLPKQVGEFVAEVHRIKNLP